MRIAGTFLASLLGVSIAGAAACGSQSSSPPNPTTDAGSDSEPPPAVDASPPPLESEPPSPIAEDKRVDATSSPVVFDAFRGAVWTANGDVGTVSYVVVDGEEPLAEVAVGKDVRSVAVSPDSLWLAAVDREGGAVALLHAETRSLRRTIAVGGHPRAAVWDAADPRWLYVTVEDEGVIAVVDRTAGVVAKKIFVGRLPSGVAVSRKRRELYVTHRIDGRVTIVPLDASTGGTGGAPRVVLLAHEDGDGKATTPHGTPFAFESLAWATGGDVAWLPHQLIAPTHPFQFQTTLFPAVSVVDVVKGAEVPTDPADPNGVIAGRKNLFSGINVLDEKGGTTIVAQPCAAAAHPNGLVAYALACGSEDLLVFDTTQGLATDILRDLPGDHPAGLALDDTGQRAFVMADQSHTLLTIDLAEGSLIRHPKVTGAPRPLIGKDPVDPELRAGLVLFHRANSNKGELATTGNRWMSCAGCHLDGFTSTNAVFFEAIAPADVTADARIGHDGLRDFFSRTPPQSGANDPPFDAHDILVAFTEQAGLAPDRLGLNRDGAVDPSAPTAAAITMAKQVARVVARDLPVGPTWLLVGADKPDTDHDGAWCGQCHTREYVAWQKSAHALAENDPMVKFCADIEIKNNGAQYTRLCAGCHSPASARAGDLSMTSKRGITCIGCHDTERLIGAGGNADMHAQSTDWSTAHAERAKAGLATLRDPRFCGTCHQQFVPGTGMVGISTLTEYLGSTYAKEGGKTCVDCHAPKDANGTADHTMIGGNVYFAKNIAKDDDLARREEASLKGALSISASRMPSSSVVATVANTGIGHAFPTGVIDMREPWVELQAVDAQGKTLGRFGGLRDDGTFAPNAARFGSDIATKSGEVLVLHELSKSTRTPFVRVVPAGGATSVTLEVPAALPPGTVGLDAVLFYRNVRTQYYRAATGDATSAPPEVEIARAHVPGGVK